MKLVSLCAGIGGLELGVERALGATTICQIDIDPHTEAVRRLRWPDAVQITGDLRQIRGTDLPECDGITGGFPCQGLSVAGKGLGLDDERSALFFDVVRIFAERSPMFGVIENVPKLLSKYRELVEREFGWAGYGVTWCKIAAAHVGAPHRRLRVILLLVRGAAHGGVISAGKIPPLTLGSTWPTPCAHDSRGTGPSALDRKSPDLEACVRWPTPSASNASQGPGDPASRQGGPNLVDAILMWSTPTASDAKATGNSQAALDRGFAGTLTDQAQRNAPCPPDHRLSPNWVEALMGLPVGWTDMGCVAAGEWGGRWPAPRGASRFDWEPPRTELKGDPMRPHRLRMLGNAVVWQQCAEALRLMDASARIREASTPPVQAQLFRRVS